MDTSLLDAAKTQLSERSKRRAALQQQNEEVALTEAQERVELAGEQMLRRYKGRAGDVAVDLQTLGRYTLGVAGGLVFYETDKSYQSQEHKMGLTITNFFVLSVGKAEGAYRAANELTVMSHPILHAEEVIDVMREWPTNSFEVDGVLALLANNQNISTVKRKV